VKKYATPVEAKAAAYAQIKARKDRLKGEGRCIDCGIFIGAPPQPCRCVICGDRQGMRGKRGRKRLELAELQDKVPTFEDFERLAR
jgi:hypothetical protein